MEIEISQTGIKVTLSLTVIGAVIYFVKSILYKRKFKRVKRYIDSNQIIYIDGTYLDQTIYFKKKKEASYKNLIRYNGIDAKIGKILKINDKTLKQIINDLNENGHLDIIDINGDKLISKK